MCSGADVHSKVYAPQLCAVQLIAIQIHIACIAAVGVVFGVRRVPLQDYFVFAIAIHIAHATVVGRIVVGNLVGSCSSCGLVERYLKAQTAPRTDRFGGVDGHSVLLNHHLILARCSSIVVNAAGFLVQIACYPFPVAQHVERSAIVVGRQQSPTQEITAASILRRHGHQTTIEAFWPCGHCGLGTQSAAPHCHNGQRCVDF